MIPYLTNLIEVTCFIIAFIYLRKDPSFAWRSLIVFLFITSVIEIYGKILKTEHQTNQWLYNIYLVFEAIFSSLMFSVLLGKYIKSKPLVLSGFALFILLYVNDIHRHGFFIFNDLTETVMSVIFVIYCFYYYYLLLKDEQHIDIKRSASFWWVAGALFFYFGSTIANLFFTFLKDVKIAGHNVTYFIFMALSILLYGCWSYSFICRKWSKTTLES